ncbi:hypothetical protein CSA56_07385 [candidate division KSB3 bacterium]|uniref:Zinc/iron-chelating domain-containing protein n=1 Tax=candidate division KSB3 bacterium TaxID=2044937 RepID=A0A2G6KFX6_9BACT|nr:MAG: hypothetical protein CSA56_07385 [candidate division KSB3 bacterium]
MTLSLNSLRKELATIYSSYDNELQHWIDSYERGVSCYKGCRTCCNMSVGLSLPEAFVLADSLSDAEYERVAEYARQVYYYAGVTTDYLADFRTAGPGWCPFLDEESGACSIHERRPANCHHVYSNLPPKYCDKDMERLLEHDAEKRQEFLSQLDPDINEYDLPIIAPLEKIFSEKYQYYLIILAARYFNVIVQGEMSWLILLAREYDLWNMVTGADKQLSDFYEQLQVTGLYHENLLTGCEEVLPDIKEQSACIDFANIVSL